MASRGQQPNKLTAVVAIEKEEAVELMPELRKLVFVKRARNGRLFQQKYTTAVEIVQKVVDDVFCTAGSWEWIPKSRGNWDFALE
ncbi:hypothetical protein ACH5RR_018018 [Cinchona calisaya]|uniref:Uncharacterized protein n=1 Tax=Cinchona calisaya TaxID=153742 RepID=A0ABD2ZK83_9GENT